MNNGVFGYTKSNVNSNFFNGYTPSITSFEESSSKMIQGSKTSTTFTTYDSQGTRYAVATVGSAYTTNITNGILPATYQNGSNLDLENSYVFVFDTTAPFANNYGLTTAFEQSIPHLFFSFVGECAIIDWGDGIRQNACGIVGHIYAKHGIYYVQIKPNGTAFGTSYYPTVYYNRHDPRDGKCLGIVSWPKNATSLLTTQFWQRCDFVPKYLPASVTSLSMFQCSCSFRGMEDWDVSRITSFSIGSNGAMNNDLSKWVFSTGLTSFGSLLAGCSTFNNGDPRIFSLSHPIYPPAVQDAGSKLSRWDTSRITNMSNMFYANYYFNQNLSGWDVSKVTNFNNMFGAPHNNFMVFNGDLSNWQLVASGVSCSRMFSHDAGATNRGRGFTGKGLNTWNTSGLTNASFMFNGNGSFNQNLSGWNTINVTDMQSMFRDCSSFAGSGLENWNTSNVTNTTFMFQGARVFNASISGWNTGKVTDMRNMFSQCGFNQPIGNWNMSGVTSIREMFSNQNNSYTNSVGFNQDIGNWNVSNVTDTAFMFYANYYFNNGGSTGINNWNTSKITNMEYTFYLSPFNQPINNWNTSGVTTMNSMFTNSQFNKSLDNWNVRKSTSFWRMFQNSAFKASLSGWAPGADTAGTTCLDMFNSCGGYQGSGLSTWDTSKVTNMQSMFNSAVSLGSGINLNLSSWSVTGVTTMTNMFRSCSNLKNVTISGWSTKAGCSHDSQFQVANLSGSYLPNWTISGGNYCFGMFDQANLTNVSGLDSWNTIGISNMQSMFASATFNSGTSSISNWNVSNVTTMQQMFQTTAGFNQNLSSWNVSKCTNFRSMFYQNSSFNNSVSGWNFPSGTTLQDMFAGHLVAFTGNGLDSWNVTGVVNANGVFNTNPNASTISTKITDWNLCNCTDMSNIFLSTTISTGNYDNLLNAWKIKTTGNGVKNWATNLTPHFGSSKYTAAGSGSRAALVSYGWTITDGGLQP